MPRRPYRVSLTLTALVEASSQEEADKLARQQLEAALKQVARMPAPPTPYQPPRYQPQKRAKKTPTTSAPAPAPRPFVTWP